MPDGFGRGAGRGFGVGMGFGFRGSSPPWPYVGRGRGGLPRCGYFTSGAGAPFADNPAFYGRMPDAPGYPTNAPGMTREEEINFLKDQARVMRSQLEEVESRISDLEK